MCIRDRSTEVEGFCSIGFITKMSATVVAVFDFFIWEVAAGRFLVLGAGVEIGAREGSRSVCWALGFRDSLVKQVLSEGAEQPDG